MNIFLKTERLIIKPSTPEDFDDLYAIQSDPDVMQYIGQGVRTRPEVNEWLAKAIEHHRKHGFSFCSVFEKTRGLLNTGKVKLILEIICYFTLKQSVSMKILK